MAASTENVTEWAKIPKKLQQQFFELAAREARKTKASLIRQKEKLEKLSKFIEFKDLIDNSTWKEWRICVVDGSDSPALSERVGARFGTYSATYHIFDGLELVEEDYFGGEAVDLQVGDPEASKKILSLMTTALERDVALSCLKKDVDLLLVDGSFFGFRPNCRIVHNREVPTEEPLNGLQLVKHVLESSLRLLESGKAIGIIKRVQTAAIDGWTVYNNANNRLVTGRNDKEILSSLMREKQWFSYEDLFGDRIIFNYFTRLALAYSRYASEGKRGIDSIFKACKDDVDRNVKRDLLCQSDQIFRTSRYFVRPSYPAHPFCFETPIGYKLEAVLGLFAATCNKATGLPLQLDLTDQDITMPLGFTREFVEEIEANLVRDSDLNKDEVENHFASINPQKQE